MTAKVSPMKIACSFAHQAETARQNNLISTRPLSLTPDYTTFFPQHKQVDGLLKTFCNAVESYMAVPKEEQERIKVLLWFIKDDMISLAKSVAALHVGDTRAKYLKAQRQTQIINESLGMYGLTTTTQTTKTICTYMEVLTQQSWSRLLKCIKHIHIVESCKEHCMQDHSAYWKSLGLAHIHSIYEYLCEQLATTLNTLMAVQ